MPGSEGLKKSPAQLRGGIKVGNGQIIKNIWSGTTDLDPGSISTVSRGTVTFTVTGARAGDMVVMSPPAALNDDLVYAGARVTGNDTVTVYLYNPTAGSIDDSSRTWSYMVLDIT